MLYLDTAASYPLLPEVIKRMEESLRQCYANPSSAHLEGEKAASVVKETREQLAETIGAYPSEIVFTSGATESNNLAIKGYLDTLTRPRAKNHVVTTSIEHKCMFSICEFLKTLGFEVTFVKPNTEGFIEPDAIKSAITEKTALVSVMHVNNELGTINNIAEIGDYCFEHDVLFHVDAAQSLGKLDIDVDDLNVDLMSFSAHKIGGPKGTGALYIRDLRHREFVPVIHGAGQEFSIRGGTVAVPLIAGFSSALSLFPKKYKDFAKNNSKMYLLELLEQNNVKFTLNGGNANSLPHCASITFENIDTETFVLENKGNFCLAQGSACSSKEIEPSHVLTSIGLDREKADKTFRISFPLDISKEQLQDFVFRLSNQKVKRE